MPAVGSIRDERRAVCSLHAAGLELAHPVTGERLQLEAPLPEDLRRLDDWLRQRAD